MAAQRVPQRSRHRWHAPEKGSGPAFALSLLAHTLLFIAIAFVVRWKSEPVGTVSAELWSLPPAAMQQPALPTPAPPPPVKVEPPPPEPPAWLSEAAARHWREITASRPHDYWIPPNGDFLAHLCCHLTTGDFIWAEIHKVDLADPKQMRRFRALSVMASRESRMICMFRSP